MKVRQPQHSSHLVIGALLIIILSGFIFLGTELWQLQVREQDGFETLFRNQSLRRVRLPAVRGKIYDAKDRVLADSIPNYCIAIYTHELRAPRSGVANVLEQVHEIWSRVGRPPNVSYAEIKTHMLEQPEKPLTVYSYLTDDEILRWRTEFEKWTAPKRGSFRRQKIAGLDLGRPIQGRAIVLLPRQVETLKAELPPGDRTVSAMSGDRLVALCEMRAGKLNPVRVFQLT